MKESHDYDFIVIGSGFGGSVSACRLSEKGYKVAVLEMGKRWKSEDFPNTNWNLKRYFWAPLFRCFGFFRLSLFRHAWVLSGVGMGSGSLVYAMSCWNLMPKSGRTRLGRILKIGNR